MINTDLIREAIEHRKVSHARDLIRTGIREGATSELYYLASQVAANEGQKEKFLRKALELDPFNPEADDALNKLVNADAPALYDTFSSQSLYQPAVQAATAGPTIGSVTGTRRRVPNRGGVAAGRPRAAIYPLAGVGTRFIAVIIDGIVLGIIGFIFGFIMAIVYPPPMPYEFFSIAEYQDAATTYSLIINLGSLILSAAFYVYYLTNKDGQTPGKSAMGIRIVKLDDSKLGIDDALLRNVLGYFISSLFLLLGYIWAIFDSKSQAWHDKIVNTVVISER